MVRAFMTDPEIVLMDEPFSALDPITRTQIQNALIDMQAALKRTIVFVTHDMDEAIYLSDRILILGGHPSRVVSQLIPPAPPEGRSRDWLYGQGDLRRRIHREIMGEESEEA